MTDTVKVDIDNDLIERIQHVLDSRPRNVAEQLAEFAWIGMNVSEQLTKHDLAILLLGHCSISVIPKETK